MTRNRSNQPATAYDLRRCKTLIDVLAVEHPSGWKRGIYALANSWGTPTHGLEVFEIIHELAKYAQAHARAEVETE